MEKKSSEALTGIPIVVDGAIIGAVGVGGTTSEGSADRCALAGLSVLS